MSRTIAVASALPVRKLFIAVKFMLRDQPAKQRDLGANALQTIIALGQAATQLGQRPGVELVPVGYTGNNRKIVCDRLVLALAANRRQQQIGVGIGDEPIGFHNRPDGLRLPLQPVFETADIQYLDIARGLAGVGLDQCLKISHWIAIATDQAERESLFSGDGLSFGWLLRKTGRHSTRL